MHTAVKLGNVVSGLQCPCKYVCVRQGSVCWWWVHTLATLVGLLLHSVHAGPDSKSLASGVVTLIAVLPSVCFNSITVWLSVLVGLCCTLELRCMALHSYSVHCIGLLARYGGVPGTCLHMARSRGVTVLW